LRKIDDSLHELKNGRQSGRGYEQLILRLRQLAATINDEIRGQAADLRTKIASLPAADPIRLSIVDKIDENRKRDAVTTIACEGHSREGSFFQLIPQSYPEILEIEEDLIRQRLDQCF